jgi:type VI secretion system protein ImpG
MSLSSKLLEYYSKELSFIKQYGVYFSKRFPTIAKRLGFVNGVSEDPHVERLIESVALLTAQLQQRLDEDLSEFSKNILETLIPQIVRPIPSVTIVQFINNNSSTTRQHCINVPRHTQLFARTEEGRECRFRTCYPTLILPIELDSVELYSENYDNDWFLKLGIYSKANNLPKEARLRLHLAGQTNFSYLLYEALLSQVCTMIYKKNEAKIHYHQKDISIVGFEQDDCICSDDLLIDPVHNIIRDYAAFSERFLFIDLPLPQDLFLDKESGHVEITIKFKQSAVVKQLSYLHQKCNIDHVKINCVPIANIFQHVSEPINPDNNVYEYMLKPEVKNAEDYEIYSIEQVNLTRRRNGKTETYKIHSLLGLNYNQEHNHDIYWQLTRKKAMLENGEISNTFISFSDTAKYELDNKNDVITASVKCINKNIISNITVGNDSGDFTSQFNLPGVVIKGLMHPKLPVYNEITDDDKWRFVAQLSLNKILYSGNEGVSVLKKALKIYNYANNPVFTRYVDCLMGIEVDSIIGRLHPDKPLSAARGLAVTITFHKDILEQAGFYLYCSVLEKFLGQYAPINSFIQLTTKILCYEEYDMLWPKRMGELMWL